MPANIESAFTANKAAWWDHAGAHVTQGTQTTQDAFRQSGQDWPDGVEKRPLYVPNQRIVQNLTLPQSIDVGGSTPLADPELEQRREVVGNHFSLVPEKWAVVRNMDNSILGVVGSEYQVIQNVEMFNFLDALTVGEGKQALWESAGSLRGGRQVWALLNLPDSGIMVGSGDQLLSYLLVYNSHDGSSACKVIPTTVRVVCWNTLRAAVAGKFRELSVTIRHSGDTTAKLADASLMLARAGEMFGAFGKVANELAEKMVSKNEMEELVEYLFPTPEDDASKSAKTRHENATSLLAMGIHEEVKLLPERTPSGTEGFSFWTFLNGVTRFADHKRPVQVRKRDHNEARFEANMIGSGDAFKQKATDKIIELAGLNLKS